MKTRILHLSDLHVNLAERPYLETISEAFLKDIQKLARRGITPDLVCITGDIINEGKLSDEQFGLAKELFLNPLSAELKINLEDFLFVPGNHEVDWSQTSVSFESGINATLVDQWALGKFRQDFIKNSPEAEYVQKKLAGYEKHIGVLRSADTTESNFFYTVTKRKLANGKHVGIVGLNSSWRCSGFGPDDRRLIIGEDIVVEAFRKIHNCDLKICMCHHPFEMLTEWNKASVSRKIMKHFDVLLNGHVHDSFGSWGHTILGSLFISTAGSLRPREQFSSFSILEISNDLSSIECQYRKWYGETRDEFGADESRCEGGHFVYSRGNSSAASNSICDYAAEFRATIQLKGAEHELVCPIDDIDEVNLQSVFVEPLIYDSPGGQREIEGRKTFSITDLVNSKKNLVLYGRSEYGKTTLLRYIQNLILANYHEFGDLVPVMLRFGDVSPKNVEQIFRALSRGIDGSSEKKLTELAEAGKLVMLIDDYDDRDDQLRAKKASVIRAFYSKYRKCRFIVTATETIGPKAKLELLSAASDFEATSCYIDSLNTARIRQLIHNWSEYQKCDVDAVLKHVLYYLRHLQLPATPLATTLFIGVLFRKKRDKNIRNEAYLIENYFETLLEKLSPSSHDGELEFKDKEDFLAHIALEMVRRNKYEWEPNEFERSKLDYFDAHDEDVPDPRFFETFFKKGILARNLGLISFRRRSWFNFFLAKALETNSAAEQEILTSSNVIRHGKALAYKAALKRNDVGLLDWVGGKVQELMSPVIEQYAASELRVKELHSPINQIAEQISTDIKDKNTAVHVDSNRDQLYLNREADGIHPSAKEDAVDDFAGWITIQSDIIRNSTRVPTAKKRLYLLNNVRSYIALMWASFDALRDFYREMSEDDLIDMFFKGKDEVTVKQKLKYVIEYTRKVLHSFIPLSLILYMSDHLGNPKMTKSYQALFTSSKSETERLFVACLTFGQDPATGLKMFKDLVSVDSSPTEDFLLCGFVTCYCRENVVTDALLKKIVGFIDWIRVKHSKKQKTINPIGFLKDDFRSSLLQEYQTSPKKTGS